MPFPEQVVERLSREQVNTPGWSKQLLMFSATIFFISIAVYFGLEFGYKPYADNQIASFDDQIKKLAQATPVSDQENLASFYSQLLNLDGVLRNHVVSSPIFEWLEKRTQINIFYTRFNFNSANNQLALAGMAKTVNDFAQQAKVFQDEPGVQRINLNNVSLSSNGTWQFDIILFLTPDFFKQISAPQQQ